MGELEDRKRELFDKGEHDTKEVYELNRRLGNLRREWMGTTEGINWLAENGHDDEAEEFRRERENSVEAWKRETQSGMNEVRHLKVPAGEPFKENFTVLAVDSVMVPNGRKVTSANAETTVPVGSSVEVDGATWKHEEDHSWTTPYMRLSTEDLFDNSNEGVGYHRSAGMESGRHREYNVIMRNDEGREVHTKTRDEWASKLEDGHTFEATGFVKHHVFHDDENYTEASHVRPYREA